MEKTIEIPEGYEARIEGNKVILEKKESEDERIRKAIESIIRVYGKTQGEWLAGYDMDTLVVHLRDAFAYLEKQKEQKPAIDIEHLKSYMLQYLQDASNREDDSEIEADTDKWARMIIKVFGGIEQKPAEWSEADKLHLNNAILVAKKEWGVNSYTARWLESLRDNYKKCNSRWKPSEEQMRAVFDASERNDKLGSVLSTLYNDLKKL